jgi:NADH dehydrogenase (ubiquinone) 1 alpha subcomplex subunit 9
MAFSKSVAAMSTRGMSSMVGVKGPGGRSSVSGVQAAVFGASGFLGQYVVNALGRGGSQVVCGHRSEPDEARHLKVMGDLGQIHILPYHLQDEESIRQVTEGCNVVVNLVGAPWETRNFNFNQVHVEGAASIARAASDAGAARLIHVSHLAQGTCEESGFATSKAAGEQAVKEAFPDATIVRPATMWGEGDRFLSSNAALGKLFPAVPLVDGGHAKRSPVWVNDVAEGILACIQDGNTAGSTFEFAGPVEYSMEQLQRLLLEAINVQTNFVWTPSQLFKIHATIWENMPITGRSCTLVKDDAILMVVDELKKDGSLGFEQLGVTPTKLESIIGKVMRRFTKQTLREADAGMQI